jgi:dissimilatory sulfite reductase (desulfoviridin) alpha/beta subunit
MVTRIGEITISVFLPIYSEVSDMTRASITGALIVDQQEAELRTGKCSLCVACTKFIRNIFDDLENETYKLTRP